MNPHQTQVEEKITTRTVPVGIAMKTLDVTGNLTVLTFVDIAWNVGKWE